MGVIADVVTGTESALSMYPEVVFNTLGPVLVDTMRLVGVMSLMFMALNQIFHFREITYSTYLKWAIRIICIYAFALSWENFSLFYDLFVNVPFEFASNITSASHVNMVICQSTGLFGFGWTNLPTIIDLSDIFSSANVKCLGLPAPPPVTNGDNSIYIALDTFRDALFQIGDALMNSFELLDGGTWKNIFAGLIVYVIGLIFTGTAIVVMITAKVGFAVGMGLAPLAIALLTFSQTRGYFESWLRFVSGFALVPLLVSTLMSVVILVAYGLTRNDDFFAGFMPFVLVALAALVLLFQIPTLASQLASTNMPSIGPAMAAQAAMRAYAFAKAPLTAVSAASNRGGAAVNAAKTARANGQGPARAALSGVKAMLQSAQYRATRASVKGRHKNSLDRAKARNKK